MRKVVFLKQAGNAGIRNKPKRIRLTMRISPNFAFLRVHDLQLVRLGTQAEQYFHDDPNTCLIKLRQFGELLAQIIAASTGLYENRDEKQVDLLRRLASERVITGGEQVTFLREKLE